MFSNKKNVLQLVSLLKKAGIRDYILCPGSRNIPLVQSLASVEGFHCISVTDERSAGFYAIGQIQAKGRPVAVCCTSGSAVLNLAPAVCEAHYQQLPLLVITADRPKEWLGQMDGQTMPQEGAYGSLVKKCVALPENKDEVESWAGNRLINEALYALESKPYGAVQVNVPISEPFFDFSIKTLPDERLIRHYHEESITLPANVTETLEHSRRILLIIGQRSYQEEDASNLMRLCHEKGVAVFCEQLSNVFEPRHFDELLSIEQVAESECLHPELVIYCGGHIVSKRLKHYLRNEPPKEQWRIADDHEMPDVFQHLTATIQCRSPYLFLQKALENLPGNQERNRYEERWNEWERRLQESKPANLKQLPFSDISLLNELTKRLNTLSFKQLPAIQVANSSMVRNLQLFDLPKGIRVLCNRGVNGIEGCLSTAVGYALATKSLTFCLLGDLSFFYDMNALWHNYLPGNLRILLLNNGNGQIFHQLPHLNSPFLAKYISASHHFTTKGWANDVGMDYYQCNSHETAKKVWSRFFSEETERALLMECLTDSETDLRAYHEFYNQIKNIQL